MTKHISEPLMTLWFGNFYRPAYDDRVFVDDAMKRIRQMGFNTVLLDSKAWEDFRDRYAGKEASQYVAQQEYMMQAAAREGLAHMFLSLYLNGDNLYPNIRFSPPIHGESVTLPDGTDGRWYKYWSEKARQSQQEHVSGLLNLYRRNHAQMDVEGEHRLPMCSMWDPIAAPSFDEEGQQRYRGWLQRRYGGIEAFNARMARLLRRLPMCSRPITGSRSSAARAAATRWMTCAKTRLISPCGRTTCAIWRTSCPCISRP